MSARTPKSATPKASSAKLPPPPPSLTPAQAYDVYLPQAKALPESAVVACRVDLPLALHNIQIGIDNVRPYAERLAKELPALKLDQVWKLPDMALATIYAAERISGPVGKAELNDKLGQLRKLREPMLVIAEGLVLFGLLPADRVTTIRAGTGPVDMARDGIALEALYSEYAESLAGKQPFTAAHLQQVAALGNFVLRAVTPQGGRTRAEESSQATQTRDRLFTLVYTLHKELRKAGHYLFGDEYDDYVPPLAGRVLRARKAAGDADAAAAAAASSST